VSASIERASLFYEDQYYTSKKFYWTGSWQVLFRMRLAAVLFKEFIVLLRFIGRFSFDQML
jgi:hypothetical protein